MIDGLTSNEYKTETTFKCLICSAILMNVFEVKWNFDPFECIQVVIDLKFRRATMPSTVWSKLVKVVTEMLL